MPEPMEVVSWDIETAEILKKNANLQEHMPLGTTCAAMLATGQPHNTCDVWYAGMSAPTLLPDDPQRFAPRMSQREAQGMVTTLAEWYLKGYVPMTWNGVGFEWYEMAFETGWWQECKVMALLHLDMFFHLFGLLGYFVKLDRAARGMGLPGKSASGMDGAEAPEMWVKDPERVLEYVQQDVIQPLQFYERVNERGWACWAYARLDELGTVNTEIDRRKKGFGSINVPQWLPVYQVLQLPEPNVKGFSSPPPTRAEVLSWITELGPLNHSHKEKWALPEGVFDIALSLGL